MYMDTIHLSNAILHGILCLLHTAYMKIMHTYLANCKSLS